MSVVSDPSREAEAILEPNGPSALAPAGGGTTARVIGVDVARGLALLGMIAVHIFDTLHGNNTPSKTHQVLAGHALATFVLLAGVSLTFITKRSRTGSLLPDAAALTTRALIITLIGLALNSALDPDIDVILPYYGLMFLLAIPLLRRSSPVLIGISIGLVLLAPLVVLASFNTNLPDNEPTLAALIHPVELLSPLLVTGSYPIVAYMAFICVGMVIGRLDLSNKLVAVRLTVGGCRPRRRHVAPIDPHPVPVRRPPAPTSRGPIEGVPAGRTEHHLVGPRHRFVVVVAGRAGTVRHHSVQDGARSRDSDGMAGVIAPDHPFPARPPGAGPARCGGSHDAHPLHRPRHRAGDLVPREPSHPTVPRSGVRRPQLCRTVATGPTARPAGGRGHVGLRTLAPCGRVSLTDKSDKTTRGHAPRLRRRGRHLSAR
jgi:hypothetical protein